MSISREAREQVADRAGHRCEYCRLHESLQRSTFHVDHINPLCHGGSDELDNLALMCPACNLCKSDRKTLNEPETGDTVPIFDPRQHRWSEHFRFDGFQLIGQTAIGRAVVAGFDLNSEKYILIRTAEQLFGFFPPNDER